MYYCVAEVGVSPLHFLFWGDCGFERSQGNAVQNICCLLAAEVNFHFAFLFETNELSGASHIGFDVAAYQHVPVVARTGARTRMCDSGKVVRKIVSDDSWPEGSGRSGAGTGSGSGSVAVTSVSRINFMSHVQ